MSCGHLQPGFFHFECVIHFWSPTKKFLPIFARQLLHQMCPFRPHKPVCVNRTKEIAHFLHVASLIVFKDGRNGFLPWLDVSWCKPISKPIGFLDSPFTPERVNSEAISLKVKPYQVFRIWCSSQIFPRFPCHQGNLEHYQVLIGLVP